ncbi:hypothetical protein [Priestia megaterium]|uniref:hypothetical protein n=1 Tax=Priestia megaterium TaxID=1404 RepID=UPI00287815D4|nr:hypothetical protein [Priestia megaterium]
MNRKNTHELHLEAREVEVGLQELKSKILEDVTERLKKGENVDSLKDIIQKIDEEISNAINIYHVEED